MTALRQTLTRDRRIRQRREYQEVYESATRRHGRYMTVLLLPNQLGHARLGLAVSKRLGGAVVRNRAKRRLRAMFRRCPVPAGLDVVVAPRRELLDAPFVSLEADFQRVLAAGRRR